MIIALFLLAACTARVSVQSTAAADAVGIYKGPRPQVTAEGVPLGTPIARGVGIAQGTTTFAPGRRFWAVAVSPTGEASVVKIRKTAQAGPIAACAVGAVVLYPAAIGCLWVSGPARSTIIASPSAATATGGW